MPNISKVHLTLNKLEYFPAQKATSLNVPTTKQLIILLKLQEKSAPQLVSDIVGLKMFNQYKTLTRVLPRYFCHDKAFKTLNPNKDTLCLISSSKHLIQTKILNLYHFLL